MPSPSPFLAFIERLITTLGSVLLHHMHGLPQEAHILVQELIGDVAHPSKPRLPLWEISDVDIIQDMIVRVIDSLSRTLGIQHILGVNVVA